jgi:hypothetical protein
VDASLKTSLRWFAFAALLTVLWVFYGCAGPDRFHKVITVSAEIHIVADREQFDSPCPSGTAAYYYKNPQGKNIIKAQRHMGNCIKIFRDERKERKNAKI